MDVYRLRLQDYEGVCVFQIFDKDFEISVKILVSQSVRDFSELSAPWGYRLGAVPLVQSDSANDQLYIRTSVEGSLLADTHTFCSETTPSKC